MEQLLIYCILIPVVNWAIDYLVDSMISVELLQSSRIDRSGILLLFSLDIQDSVHPLISKLTDIGIIQWI